MRNKRSPVSRQKRRKNSVATQQAMAVAPSRNSCIVAFYDAPIRASFRIPDQAEK